MGLTLGLAWTGGALAQNGEKLASAAHTEGPVVRLPVRADSRLWLEGTSNVRDWTCKATAMDATIEVETERLKGASELSVKSVRGVSVKVPVRMLKCGDRHMEANMYEALKAPKPPETGYIIAEFSRIPRSASDFGQISATGRMTVAGVERSVVMTVKTDRLPDGTRRATGSVPILMTDFGVKPPRPWMGILRTGNRVVVQFEIFVPAEALRLAQVTDNAERSTAAPMSPRKEFP